jgi:hypothetical protein
LGASIPLFFLDCLVYIKIKGPFSLWLVFVRLCTSILGIIDTIISFPNHITYLTRLIHSKNPISLTYLVKSIRKAISGPEVQMMLTLNIFHQCRPCPRSTKGNMPTNSFYYCFWCFRLDS